MKISIFFRNTALADSPRYQALVSALREGGCILERIDADGRVPEGTDLIMSVGGDGTFLTSSIIAGDSGIPVLGVNLGRLGFLSENSPESVARALLAGEYSIENRSLLHGVMSRATGNPRIDRWPYALNEITVHRAGAAMLGVDATIDGMKLPTYWADGLLIATSSGSTAYSLSAGGPIVMPESRVLIITPIAPHNLNLRPLIVPDRSNIGLRLNTRDSKVLMTMDNRTVEVDPSMELSISMAQFSLKRVRLNSSNFINALTEKLFWGEDIRNSTDK